METGQYYNYIDRQNRIMNTFQSSELFGAFLVFVAVFIIIVLLDALYHQCISYDAEKPICGKQHTFRFQIKRIFARLLLKLGRRKPIPDGIVDKLQVFSDTDEMVRI